MSHVANHTPCLWNRLMSLAQRLWRSFCCSKGFTISSWGDRLCNDLLTRETVARPGPSAQGPGDSQGVPTSALLQLPAPAEPASQGPGVHTCRAVPAGAGEAAQGKGLGAAIPASSSSAIDAVSWPGR